MMFFFFFFPNLKCVTQGNEKPLAILACFEIQRFALGSKCLEKECLCILEFLELQFPKNLPSEWTLQRIRSTLALPQASSLTWFPHSFLVKPSQTCVCSCHCDTHTPVLASLQSSKRVFLSVCWTSLIQKVPWTQYIPNQNIKWITFSPPQAASPSFVVLFKKDLFIYLAAPGFGCSMQDLLPWPGIKPQLPPLGVQVLATGPLGKSQYSFLYFSQEHCHLPNCWSHKCWLSFPSLPSPSGHQGLSSSTPPWLFHPLSSISLSRPSSPLTWTRAAAF